MTTQHTPGPWHVTGDEHGTMITDNTGEQIALWPPQGGTVEQCANARLIAAAPDLLAVLVALQTTRPRDNFGRVSYKAAYEAMLRQARKAIATAIGEGQA